MEDFQCQHMFIPKKSNIIGQIEHNYEPFFYKLKSGGRRSKLVNISSTLNVTYSLPLQ